MTDPRNCGPTVAWAIGFYGGTRPALKMAEDVGAYLLARDEAGDGESVAELVPRCLEYVQKACTRRHVGDCPLAPPWFVASYTCSACVYEEYVARAFEWLRIENGPIL